MLINTLKVALRDLRRRWGMALLIIFGLSSGLAVFMLAVIYSGFNNSFDSFHSGAARIYGIIQVLPSGNKGERHSAVVPAPLLPALTGECPGIEAAVRFSPCGRMIVGRGDRRFYESGVLLVDPLFLNVFQFELLSGDPRTVLEKPFSAVLSEDAALKYFGDAAPLGETLTLANRFDITVTGVVENPPPNSSIRYGFLLSMDTARSIYGWMEDWTTNHTAAFVRLAEGAGMNDLTEKLNEFRDRYFEQSPQAPSRLYPFPLTGFRREAEAREIESFHRWNAPDSVAHFQIAMAAVLLLVVGINFTNLTTARFMKRAREIGLRKVIGARRSQLIRQFLGESLMLTLLSVPPAVLWYELLRPAYISYLGYKMDLSLGSYPGLLAALAAGVLALGILAGSYPAFYLSSLHPVRVLKGERPIGRHKLSLRKILVVSQFALSILMMVFTLVIRNQMGYLLGMDYGYQKNNVIVIPVPPEARSGLAALQDDLRHLPEVTAVSSSGAVPVNWSPKASVILEGYDRQDAWTMPVYTVGYDFMELMGMAMERGRSFSRELGGDNAYIINQTAVRQLGWSDPLGKTLSIYGSTGPVIGVSKDFIFDNPHWPLGPAVLRLDSENSGMLLIRTAIPAGPELLAGIEEKWRAFAPGIPFEAETLERRFQDALSYIEEMGVIFGAIGIFAIFISCLGLVALATLTVERRTREIGVRKVLGASGRGVTGMLLGRFLRLILIANIIAWPISYLLVVQFLRFAWAYRAGIRAGDFIFAAVLSLTTGALSVITQTSRAARIDPARSLRHE